MKKIIGCAVLLIVLIFSCRQTFWIIERDGNLNIYACNASDVEIVTLEVLINGEPVFVQDYSNAKTFDAQDTAMYRSMGTHEVTVVAEQYDMAVSATFNLRSVQWIYIAFVNDENDPGKYALELSAESSPLVLE